jgi:hypothetical protein
MKKQLLSVAAIGLIAGATQAQVFKCQANGNTVYQSRPCADTGGTGQQIKLHTSREEATAKAPAAVTAPQPAPAPLPQPAAQPPVPQRDYIEVMADMCLDWYRPRLRDPRGAYYRNPRVEKDVVNITIYGTNGFGGFATKEAACEIKAGGVDEGWTKIHAERLKWN